MAIGPIVVLHMVEEILLQVITRFVPHTEDDERLDRISFQHIRFPDDCCFGNRMVGNQRTLYFCRADVVASDDDDVIRSARGS